MVGGYMTDMPAAERWGLTRFALRHSALLAVLDEQWSGLKQKLAFRASIEKTKRYLLEMKGLLGGRNVPFVLVFIPDQEAAAYRRNALLRLSDRLLRGEEPFQQRAELEAFCRANGIGFCRLSPRFEDRPESEDLRLSPEDTHFNVQGHLEAAKEIDSWLSAHPWVFEGGEPGHAPVRPR